MRRGKFALPFRYFPNPILRFHLLEMMMKYFYPLVCLGWICSVASAQSFENEVQPLIENSCIDCHDSATDTPLNFEALGFDLKDPATFKAWERVFDRVVQEEMPPPSEARPSAAQRSAALKALKRDLLATSVLRQKRTGRVPARRLTKLELAYTLQDLLQINSDVTRDLPDEVESGSFDTVGANQRISDLHMAGYLRAADESLQLAINLQRNPYRSQQNSYDWLDEWHEKPLLDGGSITRKLKYGDGIVLFADVAYLTMFHFQVSTPGIHRIEARISAYQSSKPLTAKFIVKSPSGEARVVKAVDLPPSQPETVSVRTFLQPGDTPYLTFDTGSAGSGGAPVYRAGGAMHYQGPGLAIMSQRVEGPLFESWPPPGTQELLKGLKLSRNEDGSFSVRKSADPLQQITGVVRRFAPLAFRRPVPEDELQSLIHIARPAIAAGRDPVDALRVSLRSILSSPQFLLFGGEPGELDDYSLASRLSYFLWKSMPDRELTALAREGKLSDPRTLATQVDRMLDHGKSRRFIDDFIGQWLRLDKVNATTPDDGLYPEFDELLSGSIPQEPQLFLKELISKNLSVNNLIDSEFTVLNRRLAEHYGIEGVRGQEFRRVELPAESPRGGVLTQAAVLKTTANGTTTSPVIRGNFVLTKFLGTPPPDPPANVGAIEPDTRGKTTIREILKSHRQLESCNQCHRHIDPPGFALESFDPIGGFRTHYRVLGGEQKYAGFTIKLPPKQGEAVDASGVTPGGARFRGTNEFKTLLMKQRDQVARNFITQLVVYATGGELQFADREVIEGILTQTRPDNYPVRDIIHKVVQCRLFRNK